VMLKHLRSCNSSSFKIAKALTLQLRISAKKKTNLINKKATIKADQLRKELDIKINHLHLLTPQKMSTEAPELPSKSIFKKNN